jgi:hypothetical protein
LSITRTSGTNAVRPISGHETFVCSGVVEVAALDYLALTITGARLDWTPPFRLAALNGRNSWLDAPSAQSLTPFTIVIGCVRHQCLWAGTWAATWLRDAYDRQGGVRPWALVGLGAGHVQPNRHPIAIGDHHYCASLADFRVADPGAPFLRARNSRPRRLVPTRVYLGHRAGSGACATSAPRCPPLTRRESAASRWPASRTHGAHLPPYIQSST